MAASSLRTFAAALLLAATPSAFAAKPVPDLRFKDLAGHTQKLSSLQGSITVVTFWATWCTPCQEELPRIVQLQQEYAAKGIRFVAISIDTAKDYPKIGPFLHKQKIGLEVWTGADADTLARLRLGDEVPATIVLDKNGEPAGRILGEAHPEDIGIYLDWLLDNRSGDPPQPVIKRY
jgi:thiol-disulfide isomerase/thioredoxin